MDIQQLFNRLGIWVIVIVFLAMSVTFIIWGLLSLGIINRRGVNKTKWCETIAKAGAPKYIKESFFFKSRRFGGGQEYWEIPVTYTVNGVKYKKYVRGLSNKSHIHIYYKRKDPDRIKLKSDTEPKNDISYFNGILLTVMGILMAVLGVLVISKLL